MKSNCAFCDGNLDAEYKCEFAIAILDSYPVSRQHMLVIPRRHIISIFDPDEDELKMLWELVETVRIDLRSFNADAVNIGVNSRFD